MGAELTCGGRTLKCLVFVFNLLAFLAGVAVLGGCLAARFYDPVTEYLMKNPEAKEILQDDVTHLHVVLYAGMLVGGVLCILGFLGCCGAWMENTCMLGTFAAILIVMLLIQLAVGIMIFLNKGKADTHIDKALDKIMITIGNTQEDPKKRDSACDIMQALQNNMLCCGQGVKTKLEHCHNNQKAKCQPAYETTNCRDPIIKNLNDYGLIVGIISIVFVVLEITAVIFACCLCHAIRKGKMNEVSDYDD